MSRKAALAIVAMAKAPEAGKNKTRLLPLLSAQEAAAFHHAMLLDTIEQLEQLVALDRWLAFTPAECEGWFRSIAPAWLGLMSQAGATLGDRMHHIVVERLAAGSSGVLIVGTDSPTLPTRYLEEAANRLEEGEHDILLGPALDGGYYLIGTSASNHRLFDAVAWGTATVLEQTVRSMRDAGKRVMLLEPWYDVDTPSDIERLREELEGLSERLPRHTTQFLKARFG